MLSIKKISSSDKKFSENLKNNILQRKFNTSDIKDKVKDIISEVRKNGDEALLKFSSKYDNYSIDNAKDLEIPKEKFLEALDKISKEELEGFKVCKKENRRICITSKIKILGLH